MGFLCAWLIIFVGLAVLFRVQRQNADDIAGV
jgi:hypothetical protein